MDLLCGKCGRSISVADDKAGSDVDCPHCHSQVHVPRLGSEPAPALAVPHEEPDDFHSMARLALKKKLMVVCPGCAQKLVVRQRMAGKLIKCPSCSLETQVPTSFAAPDLVRPTAEAPHTPSETGDAEDDAALSSVAIYEPATGAKRWLAVAAVAVVASAFAGLATGYFILPVPPQAVANPVPTTQPASSPASPR